MKHVFTSVGFLALGAVSLHAYDPELTRQTSGNAWSVSATVRGFYDDNINTAPDKAYVVNASGTGLVKLTPQDSFGIEVSPSIHINLPLEQTFVSLGYTYGLRWYEDRDPNSSDQSHIFDGKLRHQFSPVHEISVDDSFVVTSEPTVADKSGIITTPTKTRTDSDVTHNRGLVDDNIRLTQLVSLDLGYGNNWYDYEQQGTGSRSALLDRIEHLIRADVHYQFKPTLVGVAGYTFGYNDYNGHELISTGYTDAAGNFHSQPVKSNDRNAYSHYLYVGADVDWTPNLRTSIRLGGQYTDYYNAGENDSNPYVESSLSWVYAPGSSITFGTRHTRSATDVVQADTKGHLTLDAESTAVYLQLTHRLTRNLTGSLIAQFQDSEFNGGANDGDSEQLYLLGASLEYRFNQHFTAELGYNYDKLNSDVKTTTPATTSTPQLTTDARSYDRNRVYIGLRATY
jgi:hypothetical protein